MQTPAPSNVSTVPDPVRQQLDELDAFLQRMLGLPVQPAADGETPGPRSLPAAVIHSNDTRPSSPDAFVYPVTGAEPVTMAPRQVPPSATVEPAESVWAEASLDSRAEMERFPFGRRTTYANRSATALWLWPVVGINRAYDGPTYLLGPAGRWLRESGRSAVGWLGLGLIAVAAGWVAIDWLLWKW